MSARRKRYRGPKNFPRKLRRKRFRPVRRQPYLDGKWRGQRPMAFPDRRWWRGLPDRRKLGRDLRRVLPSQKCKSWRSTKIQMKRRQLKGLKFLRPRCNQRRRKLDCPTTGQPCSMAKCRFRRKSVTTSGANYVAAPFVSRSKWATILFFCFLQLLSIVRNYQSSKRAIKILSFFDNGPTGLAKSIVGLNPTINIWLDVLKHTQFYFTFSENQFLIFGN